VIADQRGEEISHTLHRDSEILGRRSSLARGESRIDGGCWRPSKVSMKGPLVKFHGGQEHLPH